MKRWLPWMLLSLWASPGAAADLRDPTRPYPADRWSQTPGGWRFLATRIEPERRQALIDGRWVGVGDRVGGFRVRAIRHGAVVLHGLGREWVVRLAPVKGIRQKRARE